MKMSLRWVSQSDRRTPVKNNNIVKGKEIKKQCLRKGGIYTTTVKQGAEAEAEFSASQISCEKASLNGCTYIKEVQKLV